VRRRIVVAVLVIVSLALITVYFRESSGGTLHGVQNTGATVLRPFEVAAQRVARPFEDAYGYFSGLSDARSRAKRLQAENTRLRSQITENAGAAAQNENLRKLLHYVSSPRFPQDFRPVTTQVLSTIPPAYGRVITIDAGKADGVRQWAPVVVDRGLVGQVTGVSNHTAQVTLIVDATSNVAARDVTTQPGATGLVRHTGGGDQLILDRVQKELDVRPNDTIVTAGSPDPKLPSAYPAGIQIGRVTGVSQNDVDIYKQIQVQPFVDFSSLESVIVLVPKP
jgi:rod shape-determining protein MreC